MKYLKEFIIGSCGLVTLPLFISVNNSISNNRANYSYYDFTIYSPIRLGLWNVGSLIVAEYFGFSTRMRFILVTIFHWLATIISVKYYKLYTFVDDNDKMNKYYIKLFISYFIHWNIVIYNLEKYI